MRKLLSLFILLLPFLAKSQEQDKNAIIETRIEYLGGENEDIDYTTLFDNLLFYYDNPLNLNKVDELDKLKEVYLLDDIQINELKAHIEKNGKLISIYELQALEFFDMRTIKNIEPFVVVTRDFDATSASLKEILKYSKSEVYIRNIRELNTKKGFTDATAQELEDNPNSRYLGDPNKLFVRYRFKYQNKISFGISGEKDQGEEFFKGSQKQGFDFYSAHFYMKGFGKIKGLAIGDYHMQLGQGLTVWTGQAFGRSADGAGIKRNAPGIKPYASVDENNFLRGAAATFGFGKMEFTGFFSSKKIDANIQDTIDGTKEIVFSSFQTTGFHRTQSELIDKDAIGEMIGGGRVAYVGQTFKIGVQGVASQYNGQLERNLQTYNQFDFNSNKNLVLGADYNWVIKNFNFFGELARSENGGLAHVNGVLIALNPRFSLTVAYRDYQKNFQNLIANALSESSRPQNEQGLYFGFNSALSNQWILSGYYDKFKFPWMRFQVDKPNTEGYEMLSQLLYKPKRGTEIYIRFRRQNKPINDNSAPDDERIRKVVDQIQTNYRFNISYKISDAFKLRNRVEYITYDRGNNPREAGFMINQDVIYKPLGKPYSFSLRYALFQTDSYNARIYAYENDVLYYFYIPAYYRTGSRFYVTARYKYRKKLDFWLRYGIWKYRNEESILSGLDEIQGNVRSDLKLVIRYLF